MKSIDEARVAARKWLAGHISDVVENGGLSMPGWTLNLLSTVPKSTLQAHWPAYQAWAQSWFAAELPPGAQLLEVDRRVGASNQPLPSYLIFTDIGSLCTFAGDGWAQQLNRLFERWSLIREHFPEAVDPVGVLRRTRVWDDIDFSTLWRTAQWFQSHPETWRNLTPRQVPVPGIHGKWLNTASRIKEITALTAIGPIELLGRPATIRFSYCDPEHLTSGGRHHDMWVRGDVSQLAYPPHTVLIVENQDTYFYFPQVAGLIVVWGVGSMAPVRLAECDWIVNADDVVYWGDIDSDGLRILDSLRARIPHVRSILMDTATYEAYEPFGTNLDPKNQPIKAGLSWEPTTLTHTETALLHLITSDRNPRHRRVEQERIPLEVATHALMSGA